jgi:rhodanese-related sulfurtransferase
MTIAFNACSLNSGEKMNNQTRDDASWAQITRRGGVAEVETDWVADHLDEVRIIDVREADELTGPLGHISGVEHVPLSQLEQRVRAWQRDDEIVLICRSAGRSGRAALALERLGFTRVVSMAGGMIKWNAEQRPVQKSS